MTAKKTPRQGSVLRIALGDGTFAFARVLSNSQIAVYDLLTRDIDSLPTNVFASKVLWKLTAMKSALVSGAWPVAGFRALEPELLAPVYYYIKDPLSGRYSIYCSSDGSTRETDLTECAGLERAAAWDAQQVEDRIRDHFAGRLNVWAEQLKTS